MNKKTYKILLLVLPVVVILGVLAKWLLPMFMKTTMPCVMHTLTGLYCPGCGGTRAVLSLLHGHFLESFFYHPVVMYTVVVFAWYYVSNTIEYISKGKIPIAMKLKIRYLWIALGIILVQCILKNIYYINDIAYPMGITL